MANSTIKLVITLPDAARALSKGVIRMAGIALLFALAACQGESGSSGNPSPAQGKVVTEHPVSDYIETAPGRPGGTLRVSVASDTDSLDMHAISHTNAEWLGRLIYDNLVYLDDKGEPTPWLAKSWDISPDGKTYTFHLRDDVSFSDGSKFNAEAVRINLEHMRDPATKSPLAAAYISPYINGEIVDEYTFRAHLREPYAPFLNVLGQSWLAMLSPKQIKEAPRSIAESPAGSGPFVVESYTRQRGIRLVRRADYAWAPDFIKHKGAAYLKRIELDLVPDALIRYSSLAAGQYDLTIDAPAQNASNVRNDARLAFDSRIRQGNPNRGITFNTEKFPFDDVQVRKAFVLAVDREGVIRISGFGEYQPKGDFLAANTRYYDPAYANVLSFSPEQSNKLLDAAGWTQRDAEGFRVRDGKRLAADVLVSGLSNLTDIVAIQADVKKVGFDLNIVQLPVVQIVDRRRANEYQALGSGVWHTNTADGLYILYHSNEIISPKRIGQNTSRLRDAKLDKVLLEARSTVDAQKAAALYSQAQKRLTELVPSLPLYENYSLTARYSDVKGVIYDTSHNTIVFTTVWLDRGNP